MSASIYTMSGGKTMVWQFGNSRVIKSGKPGTYQVRESAKGEWRNAMGRCCTLIDKVENALKID